MAFEELVGKIGDDEFGSLDNLELEAKEVGDDPTTLDTEEREKASGDKESSDESDEVIVSIGEESPPQEDEVNRAPEWVRDLRKRTRDQERENRKLKAQIEALSGTGKKPVELGPKPTIEGCDYDTGKYEQALSDWYEKKREYDEAEATAKSNAKQEAQAWQETVAAHDKKKSELKVKDYDEAEANVQDAFSPTQLGMVVQGADNSALVFYALGKNPKRLAELAAIKDPVKFAFAVAKLETQLKMTTRKAATPPEKQLTGTGRSSGSVDSTLERLRAEAEKTGDMTKVIAYKRKLKQAAGK